MLHGWFEAMCHQYELWAKIKASLGGSFQKPAPAESQKWKNILGKKHPWASVKKEDRMDLDAVQIDALTTEEKMRLQKEGRCFHCKKMGHISKNCQQKKESTPAASHGNQGTTTCVAEVEEKDCDKRMIKEIKGMSGEERNALLDKLVLQGF